MHTQNKLYIKNENEMMSLGGTIADQIADGGIVLLKGDLGAGKTTLVRGLLRHLGHKGNVKSPTYTLVEPYDLKAKKVYHFDLYRLGDPEELEFMGGRDYWESDAICLIEWPDKANGYLPEADMVIDIFYESEGRSVLINKK